MCIARIVLFLRDRKGFVTDLYGFYRKKDTRMTDTKVRNTSFDILRTIAIFMVVSIHATGYHWWECTPGNIDFLVYTIFNCLGRSAVPIFFMISGSFLLQKDASIHYLLKKNGKLFLVYLLWLLGYALFDMEGSILQFSFSDWLLSIMNEKYHLWFLPVMIGIYILVPVLHAFVHYKDGAYVQYLITVFFIVTICGNTLLILFPNNQLLIFLLSKLNIELCEYAGYFLLGYYLLVLSQRKIKRKTSAILFGVILLLVIVVTFTVSWYKGCIVNVFAGYFSVPVFFESVFLFIFFRERKESDNKGFMEKICTLVASWSLGIYLLHVFVIEHLDALFVANMGLFSTIIYVPLTITIYFVVTAIIIGIMKKIPILKHLC